MKKTIFLSLIALLTANVANAWYYDLNFTGTGQSETVETVTVENLSQGTSMILQGSDILRLTDNLSQSGIDKVSLHSPQMTIYPNPAKGQSTLSVTLREADRVQLTVADLSGRVVAQKSFLSEAGEQRFTLPALNMGVYIVSVRGNNFASTAKLISIGNGFAGTAIQASGIVPAQKEIIQEPVSGVSALRSGTTGEIKEMLYGKDELLRITGKSGNHATIIMKRATVSHEVEFNFIECKDASGNYYPIVKIGNYYWMAENLKGDAAGITKITSTFKWDDAADDASLMTYLDFDDDSNSDKGGFYTYEAALKALPAGWRLPSPGELDATMKILGGYAEANKLLKQKGDSDWDTPSEGLDETSFRATPMGAISPQGGFEQYQQTANFWAKGRSGNKAYHWNVSDAQPDAYVGKTPVISQKYGLSVRGIADAPSPYKNIIDNFFGSLLEGNAGESPLGDNFSISEPKTMFVAGASQNINNQMMGKIDVAADPAFFTKTPVCTANGENSAWNLRLKKSVAQTRADGQQNLVVAAWKVTGDNNLTQPNPSGAGRVTLHIFSDASGDFKEVKTIEIPVDFEMPSNSDFYRLGYNSSGNSQYHAYNWMMQVSAGDINGDKIDEIFLSVGFKLIVLDGATYDVIMQKDFSEGLTPTEKTITTPLLRTVIGDVDNDGNNDAAVAFSLVGAGHKPQLHTFIGGNIESETGHYVQEISYTTSYDQMINIACGDVAGDGNNYLVLYYWESDASDKTLRIMKYNSSNPNNSKFQVTGNPATFSGNNAVSRMESVCLVRLRGSEYPCDIIAGNRIFQFNGTTLSLYNDLNTDFSGYYSIFGDQIVTGNFDGNDAGKEQILYLPAKDKLAFTLVDIEELTSYNYISLNSKDQLERSVLTGVSNSISVQTFPMVGMATGNPRKKTFELTGRSLAISEPRIHALMAAPPYYGNYDYSYDMGTSWGKSSMTGAASENSDEVKSSLILGFEAEFNLPVVGTKIGGIEFAAKMNAAFTTSESEEITITKSDAFTLKDKDAVVLTTVPYEVYIYTVTESDIPEQTGNQLVIARPYGNAYTAMITLDDYEAMTANDPTVPQLRSIFKHTAGEPLTYPSDKTQIVSNASNPFVYFGGATGSPEYIGIGSGGNTTRTVTTDTQMAQSNSLNFGFEAELVVTVLGLKIGAGFGYEHTNTTTVKVGEGHTIAGIVAGLNSIGDRPNFNWNVAWFNYTLNGQTFPVVYYVVKQ